MHSFDPNTVDWAALAVGLKTSIVMLLCWIIGFALEAVALWIGGM